MNKGFTLAEVLITLGIIGIVAAMTLPTIVSNINNKAIETQNKKAQTILANGIKMLMVKDGVTSINDLNLVNCQTEQCFSEQMHKVFNIVSNINTNTAPNKYKFSNGEFPIWSDPYMGYSFITTDGMMFGIKKFSADNVNQITFVADLNGNKKPNTGSQDLCKYTISKDGILKEQCSSMYSCGSNALLPDFNQHSFGIIPAAEAETFEAFCKRTGCNGSCNPEWCGLVVEGKPVKPIQSCF